MLFEIGYEGINSTVKAFKDRNNITKSFTENYHSTTFGKIDRKSSQRSRHTTYDRKKKWKNQEKRVQAPTAVN